MPPIDICPTRVGLESASDYAQDHYKYGIIGFIHLQGVNQFPSQCARTFVQRVDVAGLFAAGNTTRQILSW